MGYATAKKWFILEIETGLIDGWYFNREDIGLEEIKKYWDENRPNYTHIIGTTFSIGCTLTDLTSLNMANEFARFVIKADGSVDMKITQFDILRAFNTLLEAGFPGTEIINEIENQELMKKVIQ